MRIFTLRFELSLGSAFLFGEVVFGCSETAILSFAEFGGLPRRAGGFGVRVWYDLRLTGV